MSEATDSCVRPRVIVADDSQEYLEILQLLFSSADVEVLSAKSGQEVLVHFEQSQTAAIEIDLIALDVHMPPMSGNTAAQKLRQAGYTGKIIVFSAYAASMGKKMSLESGVDAYFDKSVLTRDLVGALVSQYCRK